MKRVYEAVVGQMGFVPLLVQADLHEACYGSVGLEMKALHETDRACQWPDCEESTVSISVEEFRELVRVK